jgi:hypothetical protein
MPIIRLTNIATAPGSKGYVRPLVDGPAENFRKDILGALYLFENGSAGSALSQFLDVSGNTPAHNGTHAESSVNPTRRSYGIEVNDAFGFLIDTGVKITARGHFIAVVKENMTTADNQYPTLFQTSDGPNGGPIIIMTRQTGSENDRRFAIIDKNSTELDVQQQLPVATSPTTSWNVIAYTWDGPNGLQRLESLRDTTGNVFDADFATYNATRVAANRTIQVGAKQYTTGLSTVKVLIGAIMVYTEDLGDDLVPTMQALGTHVGNHGVVINGL